MDYKQLIFWAIVLVIMAIIEASTVQLVAIWFVVGALVAFIAAFFTNVLWIQALLFVASAILLLIATRPLVKKYLNSKAIPTNSDMNIGKTGVVVTAIPSSDSIGGRVTVDGVEWLAVSEDGNPIEVGEKIIVNNISGAKLIVSKVYQEA